MNAVTELSRVPAADRDSLAARFFGGICQMHQGDLDGAAKSLRGVSGAGDSPEQEAALYYQAQIWLARTLPNVLGTPATIQIVTELANRIADTYEITPVDRRGRKRASLGLNILA